MANKDIRTKAFLVGVKHWQIAQALGIRPETFSRMLRVELSKEQRENVCRIIEELAKEAKA